MAGQPLVSDWAVAAHIAAKIQTQDRTHRAWAELHVANIEVSGTVPAIANQVLPKVMSERAAALEAAKGSRPTPLQLVQDLEVALHGYVKQRLQEVFGTAEEAWWVKGVPLLIRQACAERREADPGRDEPFAYTYLIDLRTILEKNWLQFEPDAKRVAGAPLSRKAVLDCLQQANDIRNRYAHPIRAPQRGSAGYESDLENAERVLECVGGLMGGQA